MTSLGLWLYPPLYLSDFVARQVEILGRGKDSSSLSQINRHFLLNRTRAIYQPVKGFKTRNSQFHTADDLHHLQLLQYAALQLEHVDLEFDCISLRDFSHFCFPFKNLLTVMVTLDIGNPPEYVDSLGQAIIYPPPTNIFFADAPRSRSLKVEVLGDLVMGFANLLYFFLHCFTNLTNLIVSGARTTRFYDILRSAPNLVGFEFVNNFVQEPREVDMTYTRKIMDSYTTPLQHLNLQCLRVSSSHSDILLDLWKRVLTFPNLKVLKFHDLAPRFSRTSSVIFIS